MKNLELLSTGGKPAPGQLVVVQGLVNTLDIEASVDEIGTPKLLKAWLVRHGLLRSSATVSARELKIVLSLRERLRHLLLANNGDAIDPTSLKQLNRLVAQYPLSVSFNKDGSASLSPTSRGVAGALEQILYLVIQAVLKGTWFQLKACREPKCRWAFYDASKNHSGRWCSMSVCGSREKARTYRKRRSLKERKLMAH